MLTSSLIPSQTPCSGSPSGQLPTVFIVHPDIIWCYRMSLWTIWVSCPLSCTPSLLSGRVQKRPWHSVSTALQQHKHQCIIGIILILTWKHSTIPAARGKINSIPAKPRTTSTLYFIPSISCSGVTLSHTSQLINTTSSVFYYTYTHRYNSLGLWAIPLKFSPQSPFSPHFQA